MIQQLEKFNKDQFALYRIGGDKREYVLVEYDKAVENIYFKQRHNPDFLPLKEEDLGLHANKDQLSPTNQQTPQHSDKELNAIFSVLQTQQEIQSDQGGFMRNKKEFNKHIKAESDILKYEYINIIRNGQEENHLAYLMHNEKKEDIPKDGYTKGYLFLFIIFL